MDPPLSQTPSAAEADQLINVGPAGWRLQRFGNRGRALGRLVGRLTRGRVPYQQSVDRHLLSSVGHVDHRVDELVARLDARDEAYERLAERLDGEEQLKDELIHALELLRGRVSTIDTRIGDPRDLPRVEDLLNASRARPYVAEPGFETWDEPGAGTVMGFSSNELARGSDDDRYKLFEDRFRGPEERVAELQRPYLRLLEGHAPVLDVGCGRGEMLDLLREREIPYHGVDIDEAMIARCVAKGHDDAEVADANAHLASVPDGHYGAIFCAQVIEHLPHTQLGELLALAARKLRPDGLFIAETVNPHAPHALRTFWTDLTHQHPIFPEVALALCQAAGFESAYVFHPVGTGAIDADSWTQSAYAVVARGVGEPVAGD
ncbi:MAG: hypothetical protein QOD65_63 [Gaiellales bacterium]|nr:hypothetical protein [Gaiellales bacterium]